MAKLTIDIGAKIDKLKQGLSSSSTAVKGWSKKVSGLTKSAFAGASIGIAGMVAGIGAAIKKSVQLAAAFEQTRIAFNTMLGDSTKGGAMLDELIEFSKKTPFTPEQTMKAGRTLLAFGFEAKEVSKTMRLLGDVSAGTGKDLSELAVIFGQIKGAGRLMGQDLLQLINAGFNPLQVISKKTGKSMGQLKEEMSKGLISFKDVEGAFKSATSEGGLFFNLMEKQSQSLSGQLSTLDGNVQQLATGFGGSLLPALKVVTGYLGKTADSANELAAAQKSQGDAMVGAKAIAASWLELYTTMPNVLINAALGVDSLGDHAAASAEDLAKFAEQMERTAEAAKVMSKDIAASIDVGGALFPSMGKAVDEAMEANAKKKRAAGLGFTDTSAAILANAASFKPPPTEAEQQQRFNEIMANERRDLADMQKRAGNLQESVNLAFQPGGKIQSRLATIGGDRTINVDRQIPKQQLDELVKLNKGIALQTERIDKLDFDMRFP